MQVYATFNVVNEAQFILPAIESVLWADKIVVVDGAYEGYPSSPSSTDGTLDIVAGLQLAYKNKIQLFTKDGYWKQGKKVALYRSVIPPTAYILRMNGDEIFEGDGAALREYINDTKNLPCYTVAEYLDGFESKFFFCPKILINSPSVRFTSKHVSLTNSFCPAYTYGAMPRGKVLPVEANIPKALAKVKHMREQRLRQRAIERDEWLKVYTKKGYDD